MCASVTDHQIRRPGCGSAIADGFLCISLSTSHISAGKESCTGSRKARSGTCFERQQGRTAGISAQGRSGSASDIAARRYRQPAHIGKALLWAAHRAGSAENTPHMSRQPKQQRIVGSSTKRWWGEPAFVHSSNCGDLRRLRQKALVQGNGRLSAAPH